MSLTELKIAGNAKKLLSVDRAPAKEYAAKRREKFRGVASPVRNRARGHHTAHDMKNEGVGEIVIINEGFPIK